MQNSIWGNFISFIVVLSIATITPAQGNRNVQMMSHVSANVWGALASIDIEGDIAYILEEGIGVRNVDIELANDPQERSFFPVEGTSCDVLARDGIVFIAAGREGLYVVDFTNPNAPELIAHMEEIENARGLAIDRLSLLLYIAAGEEGLYALSIVDLDSIQIAGRLDTRDFAMSVAIDDDKAYVADRDTGLLVVDISNPEEMSIISTLEAQNESRVAIYGNDSIYLGEWNTISRVDVSDPENPRRIAQVNAGIPVTALEIEEGRLYSAQNAIHIHRLDNLVEIGTINSTSFDFAMKERACFLATRDVGLKVVDVNNLNAIGEIGSCGRRLEYKAVTVIGTKAIVNTGYSGLRTYDISDPTDPHLTWKETTRRVPAGQRAWDVVRNGNLVYSTINDDGVDKLSIWNFSDPDDPVILGEARTVLGAHLSIDNGVAALSRRASIPHFYDISDPEQIIELGDYHIQNQEIVCLAMANNYAFLGANSGFLFVLDISNIRAIREICRIDTRSPCSDIAFREDRIYFVGQASLEVFDVSTPDDPVSLDYILLRGCGNISFEGDFAFCSGEGGTNIVDISDPTNLILTGHINGTSGYVDVEDSIAVVASYRAGFSVLDCRNAMRGNQAPRWVEHPDTVSISAGETLRFEVTASDVNDDTLNISLVQGSLPQSATLTSEENGVANIVWRTTVSDTGEYSAIFILDDGQLAADTLAVAIQVVAPNNVPSPLSLIPSPLSLSSFPNPFNSSTTISYSLPKPGRYALSVIDLTGREVARLSEGWRETGSHREVWDGNSFAQGIYFARLKDYDSEVSMRMIMIK